jgi:uncharacterized protein
VVPPSAAWRHNGARSGFEVVFIRDIGTGYVLDGHTTAVEDGHVWHVGYQIELDHCWITRSAVVTAQSKSATLSTRLDADGLGHWQVDGVAAPGLDGCLDVDLESSALTNAFPVHRLGLEPGGMASAPAAYVRALDVAVSRLEQTYTRLVGTDHGSRYEYQAPQFAFACTLIYDETGLVLDYPGIATRAG